MLMASVGQKFGQSTVEAGCLCSTMPGGLGWGLEAAGDLMVGAGIIWRCLHSQMQQLALAVG